MVRTFACRVLKEESFKPWEEEGGRDALQPLFLAGRPEAVEYIEVKLDDPTVDYLIRKGGFDERRAPDNVITAGDCLANSPAGEGGARGKRMLVKQATRTGYFCSRSWIATIAPFIARTSSPW